MDQQQLELDLTQSSQRKDDRSGVVVRMSDVVDMRRARQAQTERLELVHAIVRSVDHIKGSDPQAETQ